MKPQPSCPSSLLDDDCTEALTRLVQAVVPSQNRLPLKEFVRCARTLKDHHVQIDFVSTKRIGAPVVFLRSVGNCPTTKLFGRLTKREKEVARLIVRGFNNAQITRLLRISLGTVKDHVHHILEKTNTESRTVLAAALAREGI